MDSYVDFINGYREKFPYLTQEDVDLFLPLLSLRKYEKKELLLQGGIERLKDTNDIFIIVEGGIKLYHFDDERGESIVQFYFENEIVGDFYNYLGENKSALNVRAIEDTTVLAFNTIEFEELAHQRPNILRCYKDVLKKMLANSLAIIWNRMNEKPESRYLKLTNRECYFCDRVSQKEIASYLGITPESFSRMKKRLQGQIKIKESLETNMV